MLAMKEKLCPEEGRRIYAKRKHTVEPVFGIIKPRAFISSTVPRKRRRINAAERSIPSPTDC